jgi:hypothetical protein
MRHFGQEMRQVTLWIVVLLVVVALIPQSATAEGRSSRRKQKEEGPPQPQLYKSRNFHVMTDLPAEAADELLGRLETMLKLVSAYYGRPNMRPIEMFVFDEFGHWSESQLAQLSPDGIAMVRGGGGLTITQSLRSGNEFVSRSIVYAGSDHGTPQHEAVHAYCGHAFGACGPVWYAEGMAEVGNYWVENDKSVTADPRIIEYLKSQEPRPLNHIVNNPLETTGDSWQNYAWRWALCHLLGFNENYTKRFKPLGLALLAEQNVDFWQIYGEQSQEIEFEYRQFLKDMESGYRCDLASWDWKTKFQMLRGDAQVQATVRGDRGWQASRLKVVAGTEYACAVSGEVKLTKDKEREGEAADASADGALLGVVMHDYELSEPFEMPTDGTFSPPVDGQLYLRCRDAWGSLGDNSGKLTVRLKLPEKDKTPVK